MGSEMCIRDRRFTVMNDQRRQTFEFDVVGKPVGESPVRFDPDFDLLRDENVGVASVNMARAPAFEAIAPNPMGRAGELRLVLPDDAAATVRLFDVAGRFVREVARVSGAGPRLISSMPTGWPAACTSSASTGPPGAMCASSPSSADPIIQEEPLSLIHISEPTRPY